MSDLTVEAWDRVLAVNLRASLTRFTQALGAEVRPHGVRACVASGVLPRRPLPATHLQYILRKLGGHSRAEAVASAHGHGLSTS